MKTSSTFLALLAATALGTSVALADQTKIFIPEGSANAVRVIDGETGDMISRIEGVDAVHGLAGSANSPYLVAGSYMEVDRDDLAEMDRPAAVSADEHEAHHAKPKKAMGPSDAGVSLLSIIDAESMSVLRKIDVPGAVHHVSISPDGRFAVSTHPSGDGISVVDLSTLKVSAWIATGSLPNYAAFGADPGIAYVSNAGNGTISEVDLARGIVLRNFVAGDTPEHIALDDQTGRLYVADADVGVVAEIDMGSGQMTRSFDIGDEIHGVDLSGDRKSVYVAAKGSNRLASIDIATGAVAMSPLSPDPYHLTTMPGGDTILVSSRSEPKVWMVDAATMTPRGEIMIEGEGHQMVVMQPRH